MNLSGLIQSKDWKSEKHMPVIEIEKGEEIQVKVSVGKEIPHPNTVEHHISWIEVYFLPDGEKNPVMLGRFNFLAHGESSREIYTEPKVSFSFKTKKSGSILALSYCNIHGLWENSVELKL